MTNMFYFGLSIGVAIGLTPSYLSDDTEALLRLPLNLIGLTLLIVFWRKIMKDES